MIKAQAKTGKLVAIKCMKHVFESIDQVNSLREIQALRRLSPHPHIVTLYEVLFDQPTGRLALVFELLDRNVYEMIKGRAQNVEVGARRRVCARARARCAGVWNASHLRCRVGREGCRAPVVPRAAGVNRAQLDVPAPKSRGPYAPVRRRRDAAEPMGGDSGIVAPLATPPAPAQTRHLPPRYQAGESAHCGGHDAQACGCDALRG